ncbi:unnamed protein product, partial [Amoebophrya sp. A25]
SRERTEDWVRSMLTAIRGSFFAGVRYIEKEFLAADSSVRNKAANESRLQGSRGASGQRHQASSRGGNASRTTLHQGDDPSSSARSLTGFVRRFPWLKWWHKCQDRPTVATMFLPFSKWIQYNLRDTTLEEDDNSAETREEVAAQVETQERDFWLRTDAAWISDVHSHFWRPILDPSLRILNADGSSSPRREGLLGGGATGERDHTGSARQRPDSTASLLGMMHAAAGAAWGWRILDYRGETFVNFQFAPFIGIENSATFRDARNSMRSALLSIGWTQTAAVLQLFLGR